MNLEVWKKQLIGKKVACSTTDCQEIYRGTITDVTINTTCHYGDITLYIKDGNVHSLCIIFFTPSSGPSYMYELNSDIAESTRYSLGEEFVIDGAITFDRFVKTIIEPAEQTFGKPPPLPQVYDLIEEHGTFTGCMELVEKLIAEGLLKKEDGVLRVSMELASQPGCICGLTDSVEKIESLTRDLLTFFDAEEIVYHGLHREQSCISVIYVDSGHCGAIRDLPDSYHGDPHCGTYPIIKELPMRWEAKDEAQHP